MVLTTDPLAPESAATQAAIETWLADALPAWAADTVRAEVYSEAGQARDIAAAAAWDRWQVPALALGGVFAVLLGLGGIVVAGGTAGGALLALRHDDGAATTATR